ncbi:MAG: hypothetical protein EOO46_10820 [Flavobacterium sp.]|nr:MAG: hypothetical protein EOO46_10820 [Flavobacterium sp.]
MEKIKFYIIFLVFITSCKDDDVDGSLLLINDSDKNVYFYCFQDYPLMHYPDTILPVERPYGMQFIKKNGASGKFTNPSWDNIYSQLPDGKFSMYVFDADLVDAVPWSKIKSNYRVLQRFDLTLYDLQNSNYTIKYSE